MVLEVATNTREVHDRLDSGLAELLGVTNTRALEDQRRAEGASADDDLLASAVDLALGVGTIKRLSWDGGNTNSATILDDNFVDLRAGLQVEVVKLGTSAVDVCVGSITTTASVTVDPLEPVLSTMAVKLSVRNAIDHINSAPYPVFRS